jgi:two-component sensor histidine kinase
MPRITLNQAVISVALAALLPVAIFGIAQSIASRDYARALIGERLVSSALATAGGQREAFAVTQSLLETQANDPDVLAANDKCGPSLARAMLGQTAVINMSRSTADGTVACSASPYVKPLSNAGETWWREGKEKGTLTFSAPGIGKVIKRRRILAMLPLKRDGRFDGAVTAAIDATWLENALRQRRFSDNAVVAIVDATGKSLLSSGRGSLGRVDLTTSALKISQIETPDGTDWMYASAPLFGNELHIVYAERESLLMAPSREQLRLDLLLPVFGTLATVLVIWFAINQFVVRWLRGLDVLSKRFAVGDYSGDPMEFEHAPAELSDLGANLHDMAERIKARDAALSLSAAQNQAMAREVNHRVKNNLQMVMSLLELQSSQLPDEMGRTALTQTRMRIGAIALIHRILYESGESSEYGDVDMDRLVSEICAQLRNSNAVNAQLHGASSIGIISVDVAMPISLFLVEAVTNAYRHAFDSNGNNRIEVVVTGSAEGGTLSVVDNGGGYLSPDDAGSMGLQLMQAYASQLNGQFATSATEGGGTTVTLKFATRPRLSV